jgi:hypothetical protein
MRIVEDPALGRLTYPDGTPDDAIYADIDRRLMGLLTPKPKTSAFGQLKEFGKQLLPGAGGMLEQAAIGVGGTAADVLQQKFGVGPGAEPVVSGLTGLTQKYVKEPLAEYFKPTEGYEVAPKLGQAVGSVLGLAATRGIGRGAPLATGMGAGAGEQIERAMEAGAAPATRLEAALYGGATGITEAIPIELAFGRAMKLMPGSIMNQGLQLIRNAAITGGVEGAQEVAQGFLQNLISKNLYKPDQQLIEGLGEQGAYGFGAGAILQSALDLTIGRRAMKKRVAAEKPEEVAEEIATEAATPELTEEEKIARRRQEIRAKQLEQGINVISEEDLETLGIARGKKADNTFSKLLNKNLSDPDQFGQAEKILGEYLSGSRQKFNDISTIEKVLDKQIAGEPLNLFEELVVRNYNGEDVDAYLMGKLQELRARVPVQPPAAIGAAPKTIQQIAKEQAEIAKKDIEARQGLAKQQAKEGEAAEKATKAGVKELKALGITPTIPPSPETGAQVFAEAQPDLFGDITTQGPEVTRGSSQEAEFIRQRAEFEDDLRQLNVAAQASVAGVPQADIAVQATAAKVADKLNKIPFSIGELIDIRNQVIRQGTQVPGSEVLLDVVNQKIAEQAGQMPEDEEAVRQMQLFPETQAELPFAETAQGELFEPAGAASLLPETPVQEGLTREGLQSIGIAANKIKQYEGKNLTDEGVAEGVRMDLTNRAMNFRRELDKARREYAAILGPEGVMRGKKAQAAELEKRIANLEQAYNAAQENLRLFPALEQGQLAFDALQPVQPDMFPTPTEQEEEKRFRKIKAQEAAGEAAREEGVATELETRLPMGRTLEDVQTLIDRIRPLRGKINNDKATPNEQAQYDEDLSTLFSMVKGPGRIQLQFEATDPAALALNRAFARAEGFLKNLSKKERSRLANKLVEMRGRTAQREVVTKVLGKQARREAEQFPEDSARIEARQERERKAQEAKSKESEEQKAKALKEDTTLKTRAAFTAVIKIDRSIASQEKIRDLRQTILDYTDLNGNIDLDKLAKEYDISPKQLKELYNDERIRLINQDITSKKEKEVAEREEADQKAAEKRQKQEIERVKEDEETRVQTFEDIRKMEPQPLAQLIQSVADMKGADLQPVMKNIARTSKVAENLQQKIDGSFGEGEKLSRKLTAREFEEAEGKLTKKISRTVKTNDWAPFDTAYQYAILRSGDNKFAIIAPARYNIDDLFGSFRVKYPDAKASFAGSGTLANVKYLTFTADVEAKGPAPDFVITPQAGAQQRKAEKIAGTKIAKVTDILTGSTYNDLKNGVAVKKSVDEYGLDATMRALADLRAQRAAQRKEVGKFAMDDRVLDEALNYLDNTYGIQVYFSERAQRLEDKPNVGFANAFLNKARAESTTLDTDELLKLIAKYEGNSDTGRLARVISTQASKFELDKIPVFYNPSEGSGSYFYNIFDSKGNRESSIIIGKDHVYLPDVALHEIIHSLTVGQIRKIQDPEYKRTGARWEDSAQGLIDLHRFMEFYINDKISSNQGDVKLLKSLKQQYGMKDSLEFVAEALSDEDFKSALKKISTKEFTDWIKQYKPGKADERRLNMFEKLVKGARNVYEFFTRLVRQALNLPDSSQSVFDLTVNQFSKLIQQSTPTSIMKGRPNETSISEFTTPKKYGRDPLPADIIKILDDIKNNPALNVPVIKSKADATRAVKTGMLPLLAMNQIRDIYGSDPRLKELNDYYKATQKMGGYRNALREKYADVLNDFYKVIDAHKNLKDKIYEVINEGSRLEVDVLKPNSDYKDPAIKADHKRLQDIYNAFPQDVKDFYAKYRKNNDFILDQIKDSMVARATSYVTDPASKAEIKAMIDKKIDSFKDKGPYAPLMFFGNNWVNVQMAEDQVLPYSFETKAQADEFAKQMKAKGYGVKQFESIQELKAKGAPRAGFFKQLERVLDRNRVNPKAKDELYQMTLMYLPEESFMRQFQNRKGAPTYERDALRNYGELADRVVHQLPKARYMSEMDNAIETMKAKIKQDPDDELGRVLAETEKHFDSAINPTISPWATRLGNLGFAWYMGANPSAALVQLLQTPGVTLPYLAPKYGLNPTMSELVKAGRDFFGGEISGGKGFFSIKTNNNLSATEKKAIQELYDLNVIPPAATEVGDIETMTGLKNATPLEKVGKKVNFALGYMFQNAERFNREVTALAAFRLEYNRSKNYDKAVQAANDAVVETQGDYSDMNAPRVFKHPAAKVLLMFKKFLQMMLYLYGRNLQIVMNRNKFTPEERSLAQNRLAGLLGTSAAMSGVIGMPFYWMVESIMNAIGDDEDPYYDFTTKVRETLPDFLVSGIPGSLTGANIASRTGFRDMPLLGFFPGIGAGASKSEDSEGAIMDALKVATGPVGGMFLNVGRGVDQINDGKLYRGVETMLPSVLKNFMKSYRFTEEGARTLRGDPIVEDVSGYDAALQAFGFAPLEVATKQEKANVAMKFQTDAQRSKQKVYALANLALDVGDTEGYDNALELLDKHNDKYPGFEIKPAQLRQSIEAFQKRSQEMLGGVYLEKSLRPYLSDIIGP